MTLWREVFSTLEVAWLGFSDFTGDAVFRRNPGWRTMIAFGRSVTFHLLKLKTHYGHDFSVAYQKSVEASLSDAICRFFKDERTAILKAGPSTKSEITMTLSGELRPGEQPMTALPRIIAGAIPAQHVEPPPTAIGPQCSGPDENGGFFWLVRRPERRSIGKHYRESGPSNAEVRFGRFPGMDWEPVDGALHWLNGVEDVVEDLLRQFEPGVHAARYGRNQVDDSAQSTDESSTR